MLCIELVNNSSISENDADNMLTEASIALSITLSIALSIGPSIAPSIAPSITLSIGLSIGLSITLSITLSIGLSASPRSYKFSLAQCAPSSCSLLHCCLRVSSESQLMLQMHNAM